MSDTPLHVRLIRLKNIGGIDELEIEPGIGVTLLEGRNGRGKTSVIDGAFALFGSGDAQDLLPDGVESGEVYAELSDGTWLRRVITRTGHTLTAGHPEKGRITAAKRYLTSLITTAALDPAAFLRADDEERAQMVIAAAPIRVTEAELDAIVPRKDFGWEVDTNAHALEVIDKLHKLVYDERTGVNRWHKQREAAAADLRSALPKDPPKAVDVSGTRQQLEMLRSQRDVAEESIERDRDERIRHLQLIRDEAIRRAHEEYEREADKAREHAQMSINALMARVQQQMVDLESALRMHEHVNEAVARYEQAKARLAEIEEEIEAAKEQSRALTEMLAKLDALRTTKATNLPLKRAEIRDGKLYLKTSRGFVLSSRANLAERVKAALELCVAQNSRVRFMVADNLECLDTETRLKLAQAAPKMGIQILASVVTDDEELVVRAGAA